MTTNHHMLGIFFKKQIKDCKKKNNKTVTIKDGKDKIKKLLFEKVSTNIYRSFIHCHSLNIPCIMFYIQTIFSVSISNINFW